MSFVRALKQTLSANKLTVAAVAGVGALGYACYYTFRRDRCAHCIWQ